VLDGRDLVAGVTCKEPYVWSEGIWAGVAGQVPRAARPEPKLELVAFDYGVKRNILRLLVEQGFHVTVVPARTSVEQVLALQPDAVFLSNGPGDPAAVEGVRTRGARAGDRGLPIFGICLGHQILGLALGAPRRNSSSGTTGQSAGAGSRDPEGRDLPRRTTLRGRRESLRAAGEPVEITHINLNDGTVEDSPTRRARSFGPVSPEASPGPHDAGYFFGRFREMVLRNKRGEAVTGLSVSREA